MASFICLSPRDALPRSPLTRRSHSGDAKAGVTAAAEAALAQAAARAAVAESAQVVVVAEVDVLPPKPVVGAAHELALLPAEHESNYLAQPLGPASVQALHL